MRNLPVTGRFYGGESEREIASLLGVSPATVNRAKAEVDETVKSFQVKQFDEESARKEVRGYLAANPGDGS